MPQPIRRFRRPSTLDLPDDPALESRGAQTRLPHRPHRARPPARERRRQAGRLQPHRHPGRADRGRQARRRTTSGSDQASTSSAATTSRTTTGSTRCSRSPAAAPPAIRTSACCWVARTARAEGSRSTGRATTSACRSAAATRSRRFSRTTESHDPNCCPSSFRIRRFTWTGDHFKRGKARKVKHAPKRFYKRLSHTPERRSARRSGVKAMASKRAVAPSPVGDWARKPARNAARGGEREVTDEAPRLVVVAGVQRARRPEPGDAQPRRVAA